MSPSQLFARAIFSAALTDVNAGVLPPIRLNFQGGEGTCWRWFGDLQHTFAMHGISDVGIGWPLTTPYGPAGRADLYGTVATRFVVAQVRAKWLARRNNHGIVDFRQVNQEDVADVLQGNLQRVCTERASNRHAETTDRRWRAGDHSAIVCFISDAPPRCEFDVNELDTNAERTLGDLKEWVLIKDVLFGAGTSTDSAPIRLHCWAACRSWVR